MASAAIDLENPPVQSTESPADADQMLSQLAGHEIDRLLAEADNGLHPGGATPEEIEKAEAKAVAGETAKDEKSLTGQLDELFNELHEGKNAPQNPVVTPSPQPAPTPVAKAPPAGATAEEKASLTNQLDALFCELKQEESNKPAQGAAEVPSEPAERTAVLEAAGFESKPQATAAEAFAKDPERAAVLDAAGFDSGTSDHDSDEPPPFYVKILRLINAPVLRQPEFVRQAIGRAAVVTLINSMLVIGYVLIFRKH